MAIVLGLELNKGVQLSPQAPLVIALQVLSLGTAYGTVLAAFRSHLRSDAAPDSRRSAIAGVCSTVLLLAISMLTGGPWHLWSLGLAAFGVGGGSAALMFFPWLTTATGTESDGRALASASSNEEL
jgi:hypothetical protein